MKEIVNKKWGYEIIIHNDNEYCGKILCFNKDTKFSMHFHVLKKETWYVNKGNLIFSWIDTKNATKYTKFIKSGDIIEIERIMPHQLEAIEESEIFEVSTQHFDDDNYRIEKGDSQNE
jgi:mannose-6-phosphate isomerase-like protein (cupin superfamily)